MEYTRPDNHDSIKLNNVSFTFSDIHDVVESFYRKVPQDELLKIPFGNVKDWPHHIEHLTHFWWGRLGGDPYMDASYNPPRKHFEAGFNETLLKRWLELFNETLTEKLRPNQAELWSAIAARMGFALNMKNEMLKKHFADNKDEGQLP